MFYVLENAAHLLTMGPFVDNTDGVTPETGLAGTMDVYVVAGGVRTARHATGTITHLGDGFYYVPLDATDTAGGTHISKRIYAVDSAALPVWSDICCVSYQFYGAMNGSDYMNSRICAVETGIEDFLDNFIDTFNDVGYAFTGSVMPSNMIQISGDATAADNAESAFDGTGYSFPSSMISANVVQLASSGTAAALLMHAALSTIYGVAAAGTLNTTTMTTTFTSYANDELNGRWVFFLTGNRTGEARQISDYAATGGTITLASALTGNIADGDTFLII